MRGEEFGHRVFAYIKIHVVLQGQLNLPWKRAVTFEANFDKILEGLQNWGKLFDQIGRCEDFFSWKLFSGFLGFALLDYASTEINHVKFEFFTYRLQSINNWRI